MIWSHVSNLGVALFNLEGFVFLVKVGVALFNLESFVFLVKVGLALFNLESIGPIYTPPKVLFYDMFKFNNIFRFLFLRILFCSLISWVDSLEWRVRCFLSLGEFLGCRSIHLVL